MSKQKPQLNKNGIEINKHLSLSLLQVMGADDPFEGKKFDPQFEAVNKNGEGCKGENTHGNY